ncbi:MAG: hypothetical protein SFZ24_04980 [Planctomycetota bacterium]|nr:hypothetical protein [Planctomycetota bacterium]
MSKVIACGLVVAAAASAASAFTPVNVQKTNRAELGIGSSLQPLDLSSVGYLNGSLTTANSYSQNFVGPGGNYSGNLKVEVFGNVGLPSAALNEVVLVYTFTGDGAPANRANGAEDFEFGVDTSVEVDYTVLTNATHGKISAESSLQPSQLDPLVTINDILVGNDTFKFNFNPAGGTGRLVELGGNTASVPGSTETFTWYVRTTGDVALNFVDVRISDFGFVTIRSLSLVNNPGQPDLNVPGPAAAGLLGLAGLVAGRRRR